MMATRRDFGGLLMAGVTTAALPAARDRPFILEGRLAELKDRLRAGFPGVTLHAKWQGPRLLLHTAGTSDTVYLDIIVDEGAPRTVRLSRERQVVEVYSGPGGHTMSKSAAAVKAGKVSGTFLMWRRRMDVGSHPQSYRLENSCLLVIPSRAAKLPMSVVRKFTMT